MPNLRHFFHSRALFLPMALLFAGLLLLSATSKPTGYLRGIDVSRYQLMIDWDSVRSTGVSFAFIKATEGAYHKDPYFARNWKQTGVHDIKRGAYHFYVPWVGPDAQAAHFTSVVTLAPGDLPPVLDIESYDSEMSDEDLRTGIRTWLVKVEQHYGVRPIIYTNQTYYNRKLRGHFPDYPLWIAKYHHTKPSTHPEDNMAFWQYTERGKLRGIYGAVDMNYFYGGREALEKLCVPLSQENEQLAQAEAK